MLVAGLLLGGLGSAFAPACIIPDYCIVVNASGSDWCVNVEDAQMWPIGQPELAERVTDEHGGPPPGCRCFNDGEVAILAQGVPAEQYAVLVEELEQAARLECASSVPNGYDHNCFSKDELLGPTMSSPYYGGKSWDCIGSCGYTSEPPFGSCGDDPNPWECNGEGLGETGTGDSDTGDSDTGGTDTGATDTGGPDVPPFDGVNRIAQ